MCHMLCVACHVSHVMCHIDFLQKGIKSLILEHEQAAGLNKNIKFVFKYIDPTFSVKTTFLVGFQNNILGQ